MAAVVSAGAAGLVAAVAAGLVAEAGLVAVAAALRCELEGDEALAATGPTARMITSEDSVEKRLKV